jgi:hypothetical protein
MATLIIGKKSTSYATVKDAVFAYRAKRAKSNAGASRSRLAYIVTEEGKTLHISFNGRIWDRDYCRPDVVGKAIEITF